MKRFAAAMTMLAVAGGAAPAAASSEQSAPARTVSGRMLTAPRSDGLVTRMPTRAVVRVPRDTTRLRVRLGGRDISARFHATGDSLRVADLTRREGLGYGRNHLVVLAQRRGRRPVVQARSFVVARHDAGLVRLRIRPGAVTALDLAIRAPKLAAEHFRRPREVDRRLSAIGRERTVRVSLNGRRITRVFERSQLTHWTAEVSASHGLRYGVNRLRIRVVEPGRGRYALLRRRFVVRRTRHLAAAGWDMSTRIGGPVRLDGRRSRTAHGGPVDHSWRILARPRGSRATLRRAGSARPLLTPDRRGRYVVGLTVRARTKQATAAQAAPVGADRVTVVVGPASLLVPFKGLTVQDGRPGIKVGSVFYPNPSPNRDRLQWLTLDRATLLPTKTGNAWLDGADGIGLLTAALVGADPDELVILSFPRGGRAPVQRYQNDAFNAAMKTLGVPRIDADVLQDRNKLVVIGVPFASGGGKYTHGGRAVDGLAGWLMPDTTVDGSGAAQFRFQPERVAFDTSSSSSPLSNVMSIGNQTPIAFLTGQFKITGGFHVVEIDPIDFTVVRSDAYVSNGLDDGLADMIPRLHEIRDHGTGYVAVQSIGHVSGLSHRPEVVSAMAAFGANPHTFSTVDGSYAFLGGAQLARTEVADSSSTVAIDSSRGKYESGTLQGRASIRADGYFEPVAADPSDSFGFPLFDMALSPETPWPYTKAAGLSAADADAYAKALADITANLTDLASYVPDLRRAYVENDNLTYSNSKVDLLRMKYPGDGRTCAQDPGEQTSHPGYTRGQFCQLSDELQDEFDYLDATKTLFDSYQKVLDRSGNKQQVDLQKLGDDIKRAIAPDNSASVTWTVGAFMESLVSAGLQLTGPEGAAARGAWGSFMAVYALVRELAGKTGKPVGDELTSKVEDLSFEVAQRLSDTANGLDRLRDVIISDYGRLKALGAVADGLGWSVDVAAMTNSLNTAANAFFSSQLMPIPYGVYALVPHDPSAWDGWARDCLDSYGYIWRGVPDTAWLGWWGGYNRDGYSSDKGTFVLGRHSLSIRYYAYPPATLTDPMFGPPSRDYNGQRGYGMQLPRFIWEQYEDVSGAPPTDIGVCS